MCNQSLMIINCDFEVVYMSLLSNIDYFFFVRKKHWYAEKFVHLLKEMLVHLHWYENHLQVLTDEAYRFDFNEVKGNGFRSFGLIFERCFSECYKFSKSLSVDCRAYFFRAKNYLKEIESLISILSDLKPSLIFITKMLSESVDNQLLMPEKVFTAEELILACGGISQLGFYGRHQSFYYCPSMQKILKGVGVIVATFSDLYQCSGGPVYKAVLTVVNGLKYILDPELRAKQTVDVAQNASVEFLKSFWSLSEIAFMKKLPSYVCPKVVVRESFFIPSLPITLRSTESNDCIVIPVPSSHIPPAPVRCLLLSRFRLQGQSLSSDVSKSAYVGPKSKSLLFHCHGGGFIAQNPESHEIYLRNWAYNLNVPIISVDYSLAPEAPFPRALEEVLLTYAWVLENPEKLGWTGETICVAGDSAGGNILMGLVLKTISLKIRKPDAILCAYTPLILDMVPSPSRLMCWIDPLLPLGFMISCLDSYAGDMLTDGVEYDEEIPCNVQRHKLRKMSSISKIFDSSVNFLRRNEWIEVEANEPFDTTTCKTEDDSDINFESVNSMNYIQDFMKDCSKSEQSFQQKDINCDKDCEIFSLPYDVLFDIKRKFQDVANIGLNKISQTVVSSTIYQKVISPFVPNTCSVNRARSPFTPTSQSSILKKIKMLNIVSKNPFMSPLLASDDDLKQMPPVYFISPNFDPCLDDSITFAKRLQSVNRRVVIDIFDGLPHGFLNFLPFSQEAHDASNTCIRRLQEALNIY